MEPFKATNALLESLKEEELDNETIFNFLKVDVSKSYILKRLTDDMDGPSLREELWSSVYYSHSTISDLDLVNISGASIRGVDFMNNEFVVSGNFEVKIQFVSELETKNLDLRDPQLGHEELMIWFNAIIFMFRLFLAK